MVTQPWRQHSAQRCDRRLHRRFPPRHPASGVPFFNALEVNASFEDDTVVLQRLPQSLANYVFTPDVSKSCNRLTTSYCINNDNGPAPVLLAIPPPTTHRFCINGCFSIAFSPRPQPCSLADTFPPGPTDSCSRYLARRTPAETREAHSQALFSGAADHRFTKPSTDVTNIMMWLLNEHCSPNAKAENYQYVAPVPPPSQAKTAPIKSTHKPVGDEATTSMTPKATPTTSPQRTASPQTTSQWR